MITRFYLSHIQDEWMLLQIFISRVIFLTIKLYFCICILVLNSSIKFAKNDILWWRKHAGTWNVHQQFFYCILKFNLCIFVFIFKIQFQKHFLKCQQSLKLHFYGCIKFKKWLFPPCTFIFMYAKIILWKWKCIHWNSISISIFALLNCIIACAL